jgi:hypothetical protein
MTSGRVQHSGHVQHSGRVHYSRRMYIRARGMMDVLRRGNLGVLLLPLVLLAAGWAARARLTRKTITYRWHGVELQHPAGWTIAERSAEPGAGDSVVLTDLLGPGRIKPRVTMRITPIPPAPHAAQHDGDQGDGPPAPEEAAPPADGPPSSALAAVAPSVAETLINRLPLYYEIGASQMQIGTIAATRIDAAFAFTPRAVPGRKGDIPVVMRSIDLVLLRGADALSVQVAAPIEDFEAQRPVLDAMVASLRVEPGAAGTTEPEPAAIPREAEAGADAVTVTGQVVDAESGLPIPGAIVLFLAPGTSVDNLTDDNLTEAAYTTGLADSSGHFASNRVLARAAHYGVVVVADGYRWIGSDDGVTVEGTTPEHLNVGAIGLRRR